MTIFASLDTRPINFHVCNHPDVSSSDDCKMSGDVQKPQATISLQSPLTDTHTQFELGFNQPMVIVLTKTTTLMLLYFISGHDLLMLGIFPFLDLCKISLHGSNLWALLTLWTSNFGLPLLQRAS